MRLALALCLVLATHAAVNSNPAPCQQVSSCPTSWQATVGEVLRVVTWSGSGVTAAANISDSQGNTYATLRAVDTYRSHVRVYQATASAAGALTVSFSATQENIMILGSTGYLPDAAATDSYNLGGNYATCPPKAPLTVTTTTAALLISVWAINTSTGKCSSTSGAIAGTGTCGPGTSGQVNVQEVPAAGTYTEQFAFSPSFNAGGEPHFVHLLI